MESTHGFLQAYKSKQTNEESRINTGKWTIYHSESKQYLDKDSKNGNWNYTSSIANAMKFDTKEDIDDFVDVTTITNDPEVEFWREMQLKNEEATQASAVSGGRIDVFGGPVDTERDASIMSELLECSPSNDILRQMAELNDFE